MIENHVDTIETNENCKCENVKNKWYKKPIAFWMVTLTISITISILCTIFIVPNFFRWNYRAKDLLESIIYFFNRLAPYVICGSGIISGIKYNLKHRHCNFTAKHYICSILCTCTGLLVSGLILEYLIIAVIFVIILALFISSISALTCGGITDRRYH